MTVSILDEVTKYRWSADDDDDRFPVENPAAGKVITIVQGGGAEQMHAAIAAARQAFVTDWRWRNRT
jgi:acyl-CoA reductase-like NAD-dependent aldehyde dehydrogenase